MNIYQSPQAALSMRILQVSNSFKPAWEAGGMTRTAYDLSKHLVKRGHKVTVFATEKGLSKDFNVTRNKPVSIDGIETYYFRNASNYLAERTFTIPYRLPFVARKRLKEFDIIHIHDYRRLAVPVIHYYAKKNNIPYVLQAHGSLTTFFQKGWLKKAFDAIWGNRILKDASKVIAVTPIEVEQYKSMGVSEDKINIIPNGINVSAFGDLPKSGEFRLKYGLDDSQKIILFLGRINKIKGLDLLANAFADISEDFGEVKLVIAGPDHGYLPTLKKLIKELEIEEKVLFTGPLYERDKLEAYVDADVYVLPSIYETFPNTVLEACACGLPVVVTDRCGIADTINGQWGLVVPYDRNQLSNAILRILTDDKIRQQFGVKGKTLVREKFDWSKIVEQLEDVYQTVLTKGGIGNEGS